MRQTRQTGVRRLGVTAGRSKTQQQQQKNMATKGTRESELTRFHASHERDKGKSLHLPPGPDFLVRKTKPVPIFRQR